MKATMWLILPLAAGLFAACAAPPEMEDETLEEVEVVESDASQRADLDAQTATRGARCRDACEAGYKYLNGLCDKLRTRKQKEKCRREANNMLAACMKMCPPGTRESVDEEEPGAMTSACTPSQSDD